VTQRQDGLRHVHEALRSLRARNNERQWQPSWNLQTAINDLFNQPNLDITADVNSVSPYLNQNLVTTGPVYRKGYWSQVTAGPKTGFGLLPSDDGIAFYNTQLYTSVTPITDFQNQMASDPRGQRALKLYQFSATSADWAELTITTILSSTGLQISPSYRHNIDASICSVPTPGGGMGRLIASLIGMNQNKINQKVYEGAIGNFRQRVPQEAQEEGEERTAAEAARRNANLTANYLIGNNTLAIRDFLVAGLSLRSRPEAVYIGGLLQSRAGRKQRGADTPQPATLAVPDPGLSADVHLSSVLTSAVEGLFHRDDVQSVQNVMIVTKDVPPGTPPKEAVTLTRNVDFPTYSKVATESRRTNNPKVAAIRVMRPNQPPEFAADARGFLVAIFRDVALDIPAPDPKSQAGSMLSVPAKTLRVKIPLLEVAFSCQIETPEPKSRRIKAKIEDLSPSPASQVFALNDDESKPASLTRFSGALILSAMAARIRTLPIVGNLDDLKLPGFTIQSMSPLDPSGWVRVNLAPIPGYTPPEPAG
jgi:hypothetical protein